MHTTLNENILTATRCYFGGKGPKAPAAVSPPLPADAAANVNPDFAANNRRKQGAASTILTSGTGVTNQTSRKTILGG